MKKYILYIPVFFVVGFAAYLGLLKSDKIFYHPDEISAKKKFEAVIVGTAETEILNVFGIPDRKIIRKPSSNQYFYQDKNMNAPVTMEVDSTTGKFTCAPLGSEYFPERRISSKVFIYISGTVVAYYYFDLHGKVEYVYVWVS